MQGRGVRLPASWEWKHRQQWVGEEDEKLIFLMVKVLTDTVYGSSLWARFQVCD